MSDPAVPPAPPPADAVARRAVPPVVCYPAGTLPDPDLPALAAARATARPVLDLLVPPREGRCWDMRAGDFARISPVGGAQVGDLNLWSAADPAERFYSGKTRALHGTHLTTGDRMWSSFPWLRPMATITADSLGWYGADPHGCRVHDVIGTRCDPYTHHLLSGADYHHCCHSNLTRALATHLGRPPREAEALVHDVLNVFMCTGFSAETGQYVMKASPVREGDFLEFHAEFDLIGGLSACPGGDCGAEHSSDAARCHPLRVEVFRPDRPARPAPPPNGYRWP